MVLGFESLPGSLEKLFYMHIVDKATKFAKNEYEKNDLFHRWQHIENVMKKAMEIAALVKDVDYESLKLAIIFHDIDYNSEETPEDNYYNHPNNSTRIAERFLEKNNYPHTRIRKVIEIMLDHSTPHRKRFGEAKSIEGKIIYDSDKSIFITTPELYKKYFPLLYLDETKSLVKFK